MKFIEGQVVECVAPFLKHPLINQEYFWTHGIKFGAGDDNHHSFTCSTGLHPDKSKMEAES